MNSRSAAHELQVCLDVWELQSADDSSLTGGDLTANPITLLLSPSPLGLCSNKVKHRGRGRRHDTDRRVFVLVCPDITHTQTHTHLTDILVDEVSVSDALDVQPRKVKLIFADGRRGFLSVSPCIFCLLVSHPDQHFVKLYRALRVSQTSGLTSLTMNCIVPGSNPAEDLCFMSFPILHFTRFPGVSIVTSTGRVT